jgi:hypothetical protein
LIAHPTASVRLAAVGDLDQLAGGPNLRLACGARLALAELRADDSRRVSAAATNALERTMLRVTPPSVDLGQVPIGSEPHVEVRVDGGPLALASSIDVTHEHLHARIQGSVLSITTTAAEPGPLDGQVRLTGPAGDATVDITGAVTAGRPTAPGVDIPHPRSKPPEEQTTETSHAPEVIEEDGDSVVEVPSPDGLEGVDQHVGEAERLATTEPEAPPPGSQATKRQGSRRVPVPMLVAAVVVLLLAATLIVVLVTRSSDQTPSATDTTPATSPSEPTTTETTVPAPFESAALYEFARYLFNADECDPGSQENAHIAYSLPHSELVKCDSTDLPYKGTFLCTDNDQDFYNNRAEFRSYAIDGTERPVTGPPAGKSEAVDGVQVAFNHVSTKDARVYWDSPSLRCAGELQAESDDVDATIDYWHNGASS